MKSVLEKNIINYLISNKSYLVDELAKDKNGKEIWFLTKKDDYNHIVVFTNGNDYKLAMDSVLRYIEDNSSNMENINFEFVVLTNYPQNISISNDLSGFSYIKNMSFIVINIERLEFAYVNGKSAIINDLDNILQYEKNKKNNAKFSKAPVTYSIIIINIIVYILMGIVSNNIFSIDNRTLIAFGAKVDLYIRQGQYYRIVTSMFLHGSIVHIASNMYSLFVLGVFMERVYGKYRYTAIYMLSGIIGSIASFTFSNSVSVGASGAIFGLLGAALIYGLEIRDRVGKEFIISILQVITINIVIGLNLNFIDNYAHIGGLMGGIIVALFFVKKD